MQLVGSEQKTASAFIDCRTWIQIKDDRIDIGPCSVVKDECSSSRHLLGKMWGVIRVLQQHLHDCSWRIGENDMRILRGTIRLTELWDSVRFRRQRSKSRADEARCEVSRLVATAIFAADAE
ncbi:hypothetical protein PHSY_002522 [Pseudozyma hubeiensis SY62]|uniref:Uncharacterized protein n=1 Tax=Pseudozyma hubeiensis (strain SY62) TaxID=1305764 RepID=R9P1B2_PSEHS|nr:hypothetical protein PHSY_002522 [Pseudozyma hubeiensis SY62]GAC94949.1 hypothetical protein PHSY_002522 [Pseudozyma hubeiensis SY62]